MGVLKVKVDDVWTEIVGGGGGGGGTGTAISALTALTGAGAATADLVEVVDVSATTGSNSGPGGANKKMTLAELLNWLALNGMARITVSATAPSSPAVNDLWVDTT